MLKILKEIPLYVYPQHKISGVEYKFDWIFEQQKKIGKVNKCL